MRAILKEEFNTKLPQILPQAFSNFATHVIEKNVTESLEAAVLARSSSQPKSTYEAAASLSEFDLTKILIEKMEKNKSYDKADYKIELYDALVKSYQTNKDLFDTHVGPTFELLKGTYKSLAELEYRLEECSKATTKRLDWHNPEGKLYPFDLSKPLLLIRDHQGRQVIPWDFFINNDLKYLKGGDLSRRYSTFVIKTMASTYEIKWIEDLVRNLWSPVKKLTNLTIDECYNLNLAVRIFTRQIVIQRWVEDLQLGVKSHQKKLNLTKPDTFSDGTLNDVRTTLHDIAKEIRMEYLPKRKWSGLDKRRARVMIQDIDKQLFQKRLMQNLEKFVGGREYGNDLRLLERTI
nr:hypothetical protein [Tanacetum cinerariifolium]